MEPQNPSLYLLFPDLPMLDQQGVRWSLIRPTWTGPHRRGNSAGGVFAGCLVTAVSPAPRHFLRQSRPSANICWVEFDIIIRADLRDLGPCCGWWTARWFVAKMVVQLKKLKKAYMEMSRHSFPCIPHSCRQFPPALLKLSSPKCHGSFPPIAGRERGGTFFLLQRKKNY